MVIFLKDTILVLLRWRCFFTKVLKKKKRNGWGKAALRRKPWWVAPPQLRCFVMLIEDRWFEGGVKEAIYSMFTWKNTRRGRPLASPFCQLHYSAALRTVTKRFKHLFQTSTSSQVSWTSHTWQGGGRSQNSHPWGHQINNPQGFRSWTV